MAGDKTISDRDDENLVVKPLLLWFSIGLFTCAHRYYLGRWRTAVLHNVLTASPWIAAIIGTLVFNLDVDRLVIVAIVPGVAAAIWWLVDGPLTIAMVHEDARKRSEIVDAHVRPARP